MKSKVKKKEDHFDQKNQCKDPKEREQFEKKMKLM